MKTVLATLALSTLLIAIGGALVAYSGIIDVGADAPHSAPLHTLLETTRERAVAVRADDIEVPPLGSAEQIRSGAGNYAAMCVGCHLAPGIEPTELSQGLYPAPPVACRKLPRQRPGRDLLGHQAWAQVHRYAGVGQVHGRPLHLVAGRLRRTAAVTHPNGIPDASGRQ